MSRFRIEIRDAGNMHMVLGPGEKGEVCVRGPNVMQGYWNNPEETANTLKEGWLYTGDLARMDEDGYFYLVDRKKDMALIGGYNKLAKGDAVLYADLDYRSDGTTVIKRSHGEVDPEATVQKVLRMVLEGRVATVDGGEIADVRR